MHFETYRIVTDFDGGATLRLIRQLTLPPEHVAAQVCNSLGRDVSDCYDKTKMNLKECYDGLYIASSSNAVVATDAKSRDMFVAGMHIGGDPLPIKNTGFISIWEYYNSTAVPRVEALSTTGPEVLEPSVALHDGTLYINARSAGAFSGWQWSSFCRQETQLNIQDVLSNKKAQSLPWTCRIRDNIVAGTNAPLLYHKQFLYTVLPIDPAARFGLALYRRTVRSFHWQRVKRILAESVSAHSASIVPINDSTLGVVYETAGFTTKQPLLGIVSMPKCIAYKEISLTN